MSVLKNLESKIAGLVEGAFGRAFRSEVRPVELARKLAKEMEEHKVVSLSRSYVPNEYNVYLSPQDRERMGGWEDQLRVELAGYLLEHARREKLALPSQPRIEFRTDERLGLGEFGIQARLVQATQEPAAGAPSVRQGDEGHTMIYSTAERLQDPVRPSPSRQRTALVMLAGKRVVVPPEGVVLGRSRECDIVLDDQNVSRRHAEIRHAHDGWTVADLGSTNGVQVNGRRIDGRALLSPGDAVVLGTSELTFDLE